jgi:carbonic anhydrase
MVTPLFERNANWAAGIRARDPGFFSELATRQAPEYLWIGCADSRVPANQIVGLMPGEIFVHRNIANLVVHSDLNCLSVIQYAIDVLKVKHVIVCGHYGCGGVAAALDGASHGLVDNWLRHLQDVAAKHAALLAAAESPAEQANRLSALNVVEQVANVAAFTVTRSAWARGQSLAVHGWIYDIHDGRLHDLGATVEAVDMAPAARAEAVARIAAGGQNRSTPAKQ